MKLDKDDMLKSILEHISGLDYIKTADIPNIELYMDQVTTFMDSQMASSKRYPDDKVLTKPMINNYAKNHLLPSPNKKKYSKEHVLVLIFIYYFKNILSIKDIETLLKPITEKYFHTDENLSMTDIYEEICSVQKSRIDSLQEELKTAFARSEGSFSKVHDEDKEQLQLFSLLCDLSFDVYVKKQIIEKLLDEVHPQE